ncbi:MAG: hypothetical protein ACLR4X_05605 [Clostridia bacterium]
MFNINDWIYYRPEKGAKKIKCRVMGVTYDLTNFKYILETKDERVIENVSVTQLSDR